MSLSTTIQRLHQDACKQGKPSYIDPTTGYHVLTHDTLLKQGNCCGNACRHCPYAHIAVDEDQAQSPTMQSPVLIDWQPKSGEWDVLFWSGGKDSFLTLMRLQQAQRNVILFTSFGALTQRVSIQDIPISTIAKQAAFFQLPLCLVPLFPHSDSQASLVQALSMIQKQTGITIKRLVFGDLHLADLRQWRVDAWRDYEVVTPLFNQAYPTLLSELWEHCARLQLCIRLSTTCQVGDQVLPVGTPYTPELIPLLAESGVDCMFENGEAHTLVFPL